ncbi:MAG: putative ATPase, partial [Adhaeribacter sp.]|nr:putative ATPase [Adhaeribacter sp.]
MTKGYQIKKPLFQVGSTIFYDAIDEKESRSVFLQKVEGEYPSLTDLVHLLNDFEITQAHPINGILKSVKLLKTQSNIEVIKEFFNGIPLSIFIQKKKLSIPEVLAIAAKLAQIVQDVHAENIIHKNLNPENFLIQPKTLEIKLCNFGGATLLSREQPAVNNAEILQGSLFYISPEQTGRMNRSVDYRTDFYSLGITIYQMLCGKLPFIYSNAMELVHAHIAKLPEEPCLVDANIPKPLSDIVMKLIQKNAEDRYQSAAGLKEDLQKCLHLYQQSGNISYFMPGQFDYSPTFRISEKLYGRDLETKELKQAFETTSTGALNLILIAGYSGIGKTRLIFDIYHSIARHNGYFTSGKFDQYNRSNPYSAVAIAFGNLIRIFLAEGKADFENWRIKILQALEENGQVIIEVIPELELLIGKQPPVLKLSLNEAQARFFNLFKKFIQVLATPDHPLVIFLDDLQWADSSSFELLEVLFNGQDIRNILIIGAYRNNEVSGLHPLKLLLDRLSKNKQLVKTIILHELNLDQVNQLLADSLRLSYQNTRELADLLYHKTLGNPFFLIQFIQKLVQEQLIYFDLIKGKWKWKYEEINSMHITENVVDFLVIKLQTLTAEIQQLLR